MFYSNGFDTTYEELITFYPSFYRNVLEMQEILKTQGSICDNCISTINTVLENSFFENANEDMVKRLENFLNIKTDNTLTLAERRQVIRSYFVGFGKMSGSKIKEAIKAFTGADSTIKFERTDEAGNNTLIIEIERGESSDINYRDILSTIARKLPAHITFKAFVKYRTPSVVVSAKNIPSYSYEHKLCGLEPENAQLGDKKETEAVIDTDAASTSYNTNYSYCGTSAAGVI